MSKKLKNQPLFKIYTIIVYKSAGSGLSKGLGYLHESTIYLQYYDSSSPIYNFTSALPNSSSIKLPKANISKFGSCSYCYRVKSYLTFFGNTE